MTTPDTPATGDHDADQAHSNPLLDRAYRLSGPDEARSLYDEWATTYDADTVTDMGYVAPRLAAEALAGLLQPGERVLDAGCGTGLAGAELAKLVDARIDGIDLSPGMLAKAAELDVYRALGVVDLTAPIRVADDAYAAVICVGTLTGGHIGREALTEFARIVRPGGHIVATVHSTVWESGGYRRHIDTLAGQGVVHVHSTEERPYHEREGMTGRLCVLQVV